jgi:hypothetical protein
LDGGTADGFFSQLQSALPPMQVANIAMLKTRDRSKTVVAQNKTGQIFPRVAVPPG